MADAFSKLMKDMRQCTICDGLELGPKPIFKLSPDARILIAGQAPGRLTHHKGIPFDDPSGDRLRSWLGVDRATFYSDDRIGIFPMGLCFPGSGKSGDIPPRAECAPAWRSRVMDQLNQLELTIVIGRYAIDWHVPSLGKSTVTEAVRTTTGEQDRTIILPHPSPRNNRWLRTNAWFESEVVPRLRSQIRKVLQSGRSTN